MMEDETLGGYVEAFCCPPAFRGADGNSYTAEIIVDEEPDESQQFGAAVLFIRWSLDGDQPDGHLETAYVAHGETRDQVKAAVEKLTLHELKEHLDRLIEDRKERPDW
ncbi:hypothetical protein ACFL3B_05370 [Gemmatimonadota bacterium]